MTFKAKIIGGNVVLDAPIPLEDGTVVTIEPVDTPVGAEQESVGQRLLKFAGMAKGLPSDASRNHDHYLYGTPKK